MYAPFYIVCTELPSTCHPERRQSRSRTFGSDTRAWSGQKREASADAGSRNESCRLTSVELQSFWQTKMQMNAEKIAAIARRSLPFGAGFASLITLRVSRLRKTSASARNAFAFLASAQDDTSWDMRYEQSKQRANNAASSFVYTPHLRRRRNIIFGFATTSFAPWEKHH